MIAKALFFLLGAVVTTALIWIRKKTSYDYYCQTEQGKDGKTMVRLFRMRKKSRKLYEPDGSYANAEDVIRYVVVAKPDDDTGCVYDIVAGDLLCGKPFRKLKLAGQLVIYSVYFTTCVNGKEYINVNWMRARK